MSSANVFPSAPPVAYEQAQSKIGDTPSEEPIGTQTHQHAHLYPVLNPEQESFRLNKIDEIDKQSFRLNKIAEIDRQFADEALHYHHVAKKYKRAQTVAHGSAISLGSFCAMLSSAGLATSLTGIGIPIGASLAGVASLCGISSASLTAASKKLEAKVLKHENIFALATAKRDTVSELVSKSLVDNSVSDADSVSDAEFKIILRELQKYFVPKESVRSDFAPKPIKNSLNALQVILKKQDIRLEVREEYRKK